MTTSVLARRTARGHLYEIDDDKDRLDFALIHDFLARCSHWARGMPSEVLRRALAHSLPFGLYRDGRQVGFARVISDQATFAYLTDVFVVAEERNFGLGQWLVETILADPRLQRLRRWLLVTRDAESLYRRCGFARPAPGLTYLERASDGGPDPGFPQPADRAAPGDGTRNKTASTISPQLRSSGAKTPLYSGTRGRQGDSGLQQRGGHGSGHHFTAADCDRRRCPR